MYVSAYLLAFECAISCPISALFVKTVRFEKTAQEKAKTPPRDSANSGCPRESQGRRDDNKNRICDFEGVGGWEQRGKLSQNAVFRGKRHDNKIFKVQILVSKKLVVIAPAPRDL